MKKAANRKRKEKEREERINRRIEVAVGIVALLMGLFLIVDPFLTRTAPYEELTEATIVVSAVKYRPTKGGTSYSLQDTNGVWYNIEGDIPWSVDYLEMLHPGDAARIKYQPAYYRYRHSIQELRWNGQKLATYRNDDRVNRIGMPIIGGLIIVAGVVELMLYGYVRKKKKRRKKAGF